MTTASRRARAREATAWASRADELADWVEARLVNRRDIYGGQWVDRGGVLNRTTWHDGLTRGRLLRHFAARVTEDVIGLHATAPDETCRWVGWDIDAHPGQVFDPEANLGLARRILEEARAAGLAARLIDSSGGRGGFHLWAPFEAPVAMADAFRLGRWLARHHAEFGFAKAPEVFPKNDCLTGKRCGHWLRLPGRHHKRPSWSRLWWPKRGTWREGGAAVDAHLALAGKPVDVAAVVPADFTGRAPRPPDARRVPVSLRTPVARWPGGHRRAGGGEREALLAREALHFYPNDDLDYDDWLLVGLALKSLDDGATAFALWDDWSAQSAKYAAEVTAAKWESFRPADACGGVGLGTLFRRAMDAGWPGPAFEVGGDDRGCRIITHRSRRKGVVIIPASSVGDTGESER